MLLHWRDHARPAPARPPRRAGRGLAARAGLRPSLAARSAGLGRGRGAERLARPRALGRAALRGALGPTSRGRQLLPRLLHPRRPPPLVAGRVPPAAGDPTRNPADSAGRRQARPGGRDPPVPELAAL